jgi:hypothetical protein
MGSKHSATFLKTFISRILTAPSARIKDLK